MDTCCSGDLFHGPAGLHGPARDLFHGPAHHIACIPTSVWRKMGVTFKHNATQRRCNKQWDLHARPDGIHDAFLRFQR